MATTPPTKGQRPKPKKDILQIIGSELFEVVSPIPDTALSLLKKPKKKPPEKPKKSSSWF